MSFFNIVIYITIITTMVFAEQGEVDDVNRSMQAPSPQERVKGDMPESATGSDSAEGKNILDWENWSKDTSGATSGAIGNAQTHGNKLTGGNREEDIRLLQDASIHSDPRYKDNKAVSAWNEELMNEVLSNTMSTFGEGANKEQIHCYITRDISFRYKCNKTGLIYGGGMYEDGREAKLKCQSECYQQLACVNVGQQGTGPGTTDRTSEDRAIVVGNTMESFTIAGDDEYRLNTMSFSIKTDDNRSMVDMDIIYTERDGAKRLFVDNYKIIRDAELSFQINNYAKDIKFIFKNLDNDSPHGANENLKFTDFKLEFEGAKRYICPSLQDLDDDDRAKGGDQPTDFAYNCPNGEIIQEGGYRLCVNRHKLGDNPDGTFSDVDSCQSVCRSLGECHPEITTFTTDILRSFREGCIQGQSDCEDIECQDARLDNAQIATEVVFDATNQEWVTVRNGHQVPGADRPRIYYNDEVEYQKRLAEEWKDEAYENMVLSKKYSITSSGIGMPTGRKDAYGSYLREGTEYGNTADLPKRQLTWKLKPNADVVDSGLQYYFYAVLTVDVMYTTTSLWVQDVFKQDRIFYIKEPGVNKFKAFAKQMDIGVTDIDESGKVLKLEGDHELKYMTFSGTNWTSLSSGANAVFFDKKELKGADLDTYYFEQSIIENIASLVYDLPGIIKSREETLFTTTNRYDGNFDGTGEGIVNYNVYVAYSKNQMSYAEIIDKIKQEKDFNKIYEANAPSNYPTTLGSDNDYNNELIKIYFYGSKYHNTAYTRILPEKNDVGKKGFIYVFIK